jgi:ketosteroid isomerase-like protein
MSQENPEIVRRAYAVFDKDLDRLLALLDPTVEWVSPSDAIEPGVRYGRQGVAVVRVEEVLGHGRSLSRARPCALARPTPFAVAAKASLRLHPATSTMERREFHVWTLRDGAVVRFQWFYQRDEGPRSSRPVRARLILERLIDAGDDVVALTSERGRGRGSGIPIGGQGAMLFSFRNRAVVRWKGSFERAEALEAVGLRGLDKPVS